MRRFVAVGFAVMMGCGASTGKDWVNQLPDDNAPAPDPGWNAHPPDEPNPDPMGASQGGAPTRLEMNGNRGPDGPPKMLTLGDETYRNTYYDFPREGAGKKDATVFDATCKPIAAVTKDFHDRVCVQGSGRLASGATVSFAKRNCACAAACPRTGQQICFEQLDPAKFPAGRGATGKAITPFRTIAVDSNVIPLGTPVFIPEYVGLPRADGTLHDGCFLAEDRGSRVVGKQVDVFTGDPAQTARWNKLVPSNQGVHVKRNEPRCTR